MKAFIARGLGKKHILIAGFRFTGKGFLKVFSVWLITVAPLFCIGYKVVYKKSIVMCQKKYIFTW